MSENNTQKLILIDPPSGWKYGFPKAITQEQYKEITSLKEWCIENGYPKEEADSYRECFYIRISKELPETNQNFGLFGGGSKPEPTYTEEEVRQLFIDRAKEFSPSSRVFGDFLLKQDLEWFEQNKKK